MRITATPYISFGADYIPPRKWLVSDIIPAAGMSLITGDPATAKSFLAIHAAAAVATGSPFLAHDTKQTGVLYVATEGNAMIGARLAAALRKVGASPDARLRLAAGAPETFDDTLAVIREARDHFEERGLELGLIVIDSWFAASLGLGLDQRQAIQPLQALKAESGDAHVMLTSSIPSAREEAAAQVILSTKRNESGQFSVSIDKHHTLIEGRRFEFALEPVEIGCDEDGEPWFTCVVNPGARH